MRAPSTESLFVATFALLGVRIGAQPIADNSTFVHLRVGLDALAGFGIPRRDPYSFTAAGEPWVVQSWLADLSYAVAHRLAGPGGVVFQHAVMFGVLAWLLARLARTGSPLRTALGAGLAVGAGISYWSPRPLVFGLLAFAVVVSVVRSERSPWWLVPVLWVWVNTHGSFVLGILWLLLSTAGEALDHRGRPVVLPRYLPPAAVGLVVAAVNPLGPRLLTFSSTLAGRREVFSTVVEWRSPMFDSPGRLLALVCLVGAVVVIARARTPWSDLLPVAVFVVAGFVAQRNIPIAAVTLAPALARALRTAVPAAVTPPLPANVGIALVVAGGMVAFSVAGLRGPGLDLEPYPVAAVDRARSEGLVGGPRRVVAQDHVGGYLLLRFGRETPVFVDDRVDMYPIEVSRDYRALLLGRPQSLTVLDRHGAETVLWQLDLPLATILDVSTGWRRAYTADGWGVFVRSR